MGVKCANCGTENEGWVPKDRLDAALEDRRKEREKREAAESALSSAQTESETQLKDLRKQLEDAQRASGAAAELQKQLEQYQAKEETWGLERSIIRSGITDDEGVEFASLAWQRVPEDQRPEGGISAWLENRDALPKAVRAYLPDTSSNAPTPASEPPSAAPETPAAPAPQAAPPPSTRGTDPNASAPAPGRLTAEQLRAMTPEEFKAHREVIYKQNGWA